MFKIKNIKQFIFFAACNDNARLSEVYKKIEI